MACEKDDGIFRELLQQLLPTAISQTNAVHSIRLTDRLHPALRLYILRTASCSLQLDL